MKLLKRDFAFRIVSVIIAVAILSASVFLSTGCNLKSLVPKGSEDTTGDTGEAIDAIVTTATPDVTEDTTAAHTVLYYSRLTGLVTEKDISSMRPVSICIGNTASSLPQEGIEYADILVEAPVEGGITRLMMITDDISSIENIGSVRSTRSYLAAISNDFGAISVYAGTTDTGTSQKISDIDALDSMTSSASSVFTRDETRRLTLGYEHSLMTSGSRILAGISQNKFSCTLSESFSMPYNILTDKTVTPSYDSAAYIKIPFYSTQIVEFTYDASTRSYLRFQNGAPHTFSSGEQLSYANIIILFCYATTTETSTVSLIDLDTSSGGEGYYLYGGKYEKITWSRSSDGIMTVLAADGTTLEVNAGNTYIALARSSQKSSVVFGK